MAAPKEDRYIRISFENKNITITIPNSDTSTYPFTFYKNKVIFDNKEYFYSDYDNTLTESYLDNIVSFTQKVGTATKKINLGEKDYYLVSDGYSLDVFYSANFKPSYYINNKLAIEDSDISLQELIDNTKVTKLTLTEIAKGFEDSSAFHIGDSIIAINIYRRKLQT